MARLIENCQFLQTREIWAIYTGDYYGLLKLSGEAHLYYYGEIKGNLDIDNINADDWYTTKIINPYYECKVLDLRDIYGT